ncbi:tetratricopeptide repeat protein [Cardiobacteriaceae bacterium TAE3-ERU3]|nr:tetratricopeptide repeat protein [Cardiobacteriaceae bacterium TAE3-ERU3]
MIDRTDEETGELVRAWLQRYGLAIIGGIVLAIVVIAGYEWWKNKQQHIAGEVSAQVIALNEAVAADELDKAEATYAKIEDGNLKPLASLLMAAAYSNDNQLDKAQNYYDLAAKSDDALVSQTANWQLAQIHITKQDYSAAKQTLQALKGSAYERQIPLLNAVIAQNQGEQQAALDAYKQALRDNPDESGFIQAQVAALEGELAVNTEKEK